eukprot:TRINITY_DN13180_c0_g1_i1.p1 TRINITY_DN13180_c0_g1~~TRINITY_DN13180_c0_g1_i1.p1  ORF type:complete len:451 (+),score=93.51 TRINITY_DN13180_c0_g1_i1:99-1355(+)
MQEGLCANSSSSLAMLPSYVTKLPSGDETGTVYAMDMGGSNLRVLKVELKGNGVVTCDAVVKKEIPIEIQRGQSGEELFDFLAEAVAELTKSGRLGFTFSYPVEQQNLHSGVLLKWTKNFTVPGVVGNDVCDLLHQSFHKVGVDMKVSAMISDTVGTLLSGAYQARNLGVEGDAKCFAGLILGTGTNVCYMEKLENIKKLNTEGQEGFMAINAETGNFGSRVGFVGVHLPLTEFDIALDASSPNKGLQLLEKQIAGLYLGEIWRLTIEKYIKDGSLFVNLVKENTALLESFGVDTSNLSAIEADNSDDLKETEKILNNLGVKESSIEERRFVKDVCHIIAVRAARLTSTLLCALLKHTGLDTDTTSQPVVAIDGSVFEKFPGFPEMMHEAVVELLGRDAMQFVLAQEGSGYGAALASL